MDPITFDEIPYDWQEPGTYVEVRPNYRGVGILPWPVKALIAGPLTDEAAMAPGEVREITRDEDAAVLFGARSLAVKAVAAFRRKNRIAPLFVTGLADADGAVKAAGTVTFTGAVSVATVLRFTIDGTPVRCTVAPGDDVAAMATALAAALNAEPTLPVTAAAALGVVTITSVHGGEIGNEIDVRVDTRAQPVPSGLTVDVSGMANGSGNPDLQDVLDLIAGDWYTAFVNPWTDATNMGALATDMKARYEAMSKRDCHAFAFKAGTYGQLVTFGALTNSPFISKGGAKRPRSHPFTFASSMAGLASFHLANDPARQLRSLTLDGAIGWDAEDAFTEEEQNLLLGQGISTFDRIGDGTITVSRMITSYKVSNLGVADRAWMDIMVPATASRIRYDWAGYVSLLYPRAKLIPDENTAAFTAPPGSGQGAGNSVVTPRRMHASWAARCREYGNRAWLQDVERTIEESRFEIDPDDGNRMNARQQIKIVGNLMVLAGALEFQV